MDLLLSNATIIDGTGRVYERGYVLIEGAVVRRIGSGAPPDAIPPKVRRVDLAGKTVFPGLIDCHVHLCLDGGPSPAHQIASETYAITLLRAARNARRQVESGVTTVRDLSSRCCSTPDGSGGVAFNVRQAIAEDICTGPRIMQAGRAICITGGHGWWFGHEADGPDEVRRAVRSELKNGAQVIKFMATGGIATITSGDRFAPQLTAEEIAAGVEEARRMGTRTAAHAEGATGIKNALKAGVDSVEHGSYLDDEALEMMLDRGVYYVPTFAVRRRIADEGAQGGVPAFILDVVKRVLDRHRESLERARKAGVRVALGTDAGASLFGHGESARELEELVGAGFSPAEALRAGTASAAELLGMQELIGTLEEGKRADLVVMDGDPLSNIRVLQDVSRIKAVLIDGRPVIDRLSLGPVASGPGPT
jgi:imidazolonepropionase-like amidohydrolase